MQAQKVLHKLIHNTCTDMHQRRRTALEATIMAALTGQRLTVTDLGRSIQSQTSHKHNIKRADRLLSNTHLHQETLSIYRTLCHQLVGAQTRPIILIDWSDMDEYKQHFVLRAAIAMEGRTVTLYDEVHTLKTKPLLTKYPGNRGRTRDTCFAISLIAFNAILRKTIYNQHPRNNQVDICLSKYFNVHICR